MADIDDPREAGPFELVPPSIAASDTLRSLQTNQLRLSALADQKASILVGASMVVMGVVAPLQGEVSVAMVLLALTAAVAGCSGILALVPRFSQPLGRPNLFFFGVHSRLDGDEFHRRIAEVISDDALMYATLTEDIHQVGKVLTRKFRLVDFAYRALFVGLVATAVAVGLGI